jgi:hypothetical protein
MSRFLREARRLARSRNTSPLLRATLRYMLANSVGQRHATPIDTIIRHLNSRGFQINREQFQHQVLVPSREGTLYIASFGHFGRGGIYLIETREDTKPMISFYKRRIAKERQHLNHLVDLCDAEWP